MSINCKLSHLIDNKTAFATQLLVIAQLGLEGLARNVTRFVMRRELDLVETVFTVAELN